MSPNLAPAQIASLRQQLADSVGAANLLVDPEDTARYLRDARDRYQGSTLAVVRPASTAEVAAVVAGCAAAGVAIVPQGGNTGMCGGATPQTQSPCVVVALERMNRIRDIDAADSTMTVDAGCTLAAVQAAAREAGKLFPMSLGSEGSCQIGGNIATNAGGTAVLRYGCMRELVLGLEVVLPDGRVWNALRRLRKDNTGYDLKQLIIGSEGTLGVVTGAVLKLYARPARALTALVALDSVEQVLDLLGEFRRSFGEHITTFEAMSHSEYALVLRTHRDLRDPLPRRAAWYAFIEVTSELESMDPRAALESCLARSQQAGWVSDATIADSLAQADNIWAIRHGVTEANLRAGAAVSHDTSVPVSRIADFVAGSEAAIRAAFPAAQVLFVGHVGDGNIHVVAILPREDYAAAEAFARVADEINALVDRVTVDLGGSISAEHGIGRSNRARLRRYKDPIELEFMARVKAMLDPAGLMNPGVLL